MQRVEALNTRFQFRGNAAFHQLCANRALDFFQEPLVDGSLVRNFLLQREKRVGIEKAEGQIFEFPADDPHAQAVRDGCVNI